MPAVINGSPWAAAPAVLTEADGHEVVVVVVKATFVWGDSGEVTAVVEQPAVRFADELAGDPASSGVLRAADVGLPKPRVDLLFAGEIALPEPATEADVAFQVGTRLRKGARVFGPRVFVPGVMRAVVPSRPRPFTRVAIVWENCYGGTDPEAPEVYEPRNPVGRGVRKDPRALEGTLAPCFEDLEAPLTHAGARTRPVGFGPIAAHWAPRIGRAGTYDAAWLAKRSPLLPPDFDRRFLNVAPDDQQLEGYEPGEEVRLGNMTPGRLERFRLPALDVSVTFADGGVAVTRPAVVDTITIEPAARRVTLVGRAVCVPRAGVEEVRRIFVGPLTPGKRRALATGKVWCGR